MAHYFKAVEDIEEAWKLMARGCVLVVDIDNSHRIMYYRRHPDKFNLIQESDDQVKWYAVDTNGIDMAAVNGMFVDVGEIR